MVSVEYTFLRAMMTSSTRHDVAMQVVGQPARDLARHFVER